jgi:DNA-binding SARP family transcriptional activator
VTTSRSEGPGQALDVQLCGDVRVSRGGVVLDLSTTARQGRLAFAYLVLNRGRVVTRDELMEHVWRDPDPARVSASLSQTLSRLRKVLGRDVLERAHGGAVRLTGPLHLDLERAETMLEEGLEAQLRGESQRASDAAHAVLDALSGEVLAGDDAEWLEPVRRLVADQRLEALELQAAAALRLGLVSSALAAAQKAVAVGGTRESAWELLIEAQAAHGDVGLATQTFDRFRHRLAEESGLTPSARLVELHRRLVAGEPVHGGGAAAHALPFPPALLSESGDAPFIGRERVLDRLRHRFARARDGSRQFVLLSGEPGIGKTRVASEFAQEAHADGAIVLYGRSDAETFVPYQPFVTAIERYVEGCGEELARALPAEVSELSRLIPGLRRRMPHVREPLAVEPEMRTYRLFNAVSHVLTFAGRERAAVLILDDLQWADPSTALLLRHTLHAVHEVKLLVLATYRDAEPVRSDELADLLARSPRGFERLSLRGLDASETTALVRAHQARGATTSAVTRLLEATGGNPLLLEETLKSLAESDRRGEGLSEEAVRHVGVPEGAKHVIARRVQRLSRTAQDALATASVIGLEFDVRVLVAAADCPDDEMITALEEAQRSGLLREVRDAVDRFSFSHALVRDALREGQSSARRRRLHHRIGEALETYAESGEVHPAELSHHFSESNERGDAAKALKYSLAAGDRATVERAHENAAGHYRRALRLLPPGDERLRCDVLLSLGRVELRQGSSESRQTFGHAFELAERNGLTEQLARAALGIASRYTEAGVVDTDGIARLRAARDALGTGPTALRAEVTARLADALHFAPEHGEAEQLSSEALAMAREVGDPHALAAALESRHAALLSIEHLDERLRLGRELVAFAEREGERELKALGHHWLIYDLLEAADVEGASRERLALDALAEDLRQPLYTHFSVGWDVVWAHMTGRVDEVESLAQRFRALGIEAQARDTETIYRAQMIALRRRQERLSDFVSTVREAVVANPTLLAWRAVLPLAHLASGDVRAAVAEFEWFAAERFGRVRRDMFWFTTVCVLAETCALIRDGARARVLYELLEPFASRNVQVGQAACWGSAERFLGLLAAAMGQSETAEAHLRSAIAGNESCGNAAAASLVQRDYARMLLARGGREDLTLAAELLRGPLEAAREAGTEPLIERIEGELHAVEQARRAARDGGGSASSVAAG